MLVVMISTRPPYGRVRVARTAAVAPSAPHTSVAGVVLVTVDGAINILFILYIKIFFYNIFNYTCALCR
jgi:hypothetical protein